MRRIVTVLTVTALMVVLMATAVSPAFAEPPEQYGWNKPEGVTAIGFGATDEDGQIGFCDPARTKQELKWNCPAEDNR